MLPIERAQGGIELLAELEKAGAVNATSLVLPPELPWDQYEALAAMFGQLHRTSSWLIGDLLNFGEKVYGEKYTQAAVLTGLADQTLMNYASVCAHVPRSRRRATLPFSVHAEVAYKTPQEQEEWLKKAVENRWTRAQLRDAMRGPAELVQAPGPQIHSEPPETEEDVDLLLRTLRGMFTEEGVSAWLATAIKQRWTIEECYSRAIGPDVVYV